MCVVTAESRAETAAAIQQGQDAVAAFETAARQFDETAARMHALGQKIEAGQDAYHDPAGAMGR